jgi:hypothetical protein
VKRHKGLKRGASVYSSTGEVTQKAPQLTPARITEIGHSSGNPLRMISDSIKRFPVNND